MTYTLETIGYQSNDSFPLKLDELVSCIYASIKGGKNLSTDSPYTAKLQNLIFERLGVKVVYTPALTPISPAAIIPFFKDYELSTNDLMGVTDSFQSASAGSLYSKIRVIVKDREAMLRKIDNRAGFINTKLAKMGGYMSEVSHYLILDFGLFKRMGLSPQELTSIILHELGHAFDGMEEHYRIHSTNRAITDILMDIHNNTPDKALYKFKRDATKQEFDQAQLSTSRDRQDFCGKLAMRFLKTAQSQFENAKYDETNFENMADTFATRFGRGKDLSSALAKLHGVKIDTNAAALRLTLASLEILAIASFFLVIPLYGAIVYTVIMSYLLRVSSSPMIYDDFYNRLQRIKNTIVNSLKDKGLPAELVKSALEQIAFIEKMSTAGREYKSFTSDLGDLLYSDARSDTYHINLQRQIEHYLNNRLFVQSAQVKLAL